MCKPIKSRLASCTLGCTFISDVITFLRLKTTHTEVHHPFTAHYRITEEHYNYPLI